MTIKTQLFSLILAATLFGASIAVGGRKSTYYPVNPKDPVVLDLAKFAVATYNGRAKTNFIVTTVLDARIYTDTTIQGTYYGVDFQAAVDNTKPNTFESTVLVLPDSRKIVGTVEITG